MTPKLLSMTLDIPGNLVKVVWEQEDGTQHTETTDLRHLRELSLSYSDYEVKNYSISYGLTKEEIEGAVSSGKLYHRV